MVNSERNFTELGVNGTFLPMSSGVIFQPVLDGVGGEIAYPYAIYQST